MILFLVSYWHILREQPWRNRKMGDQEDIEELKRSVRKLEDKFLIAATIAVFLGISGAALGAWVGRLEQRVHQLDPFVKKAEAELRTASGEQLALIATKGGPIVSGLVKEDLDAAAHKPKELSEIYTLANNESSPKKLMLINEAFCYLTGTDGSFGVPTTLRVEPDRDGYWKLYVSSTGRTDLYLYGHAVCVKY
jgi:hypothetical protein